MRNTVIRVAGSLLIVWVIAYAARGVFVWQHYALVLALVLMWNGLFGLVVAPRVRGNAR